MNNESLDNWYIKATVLHPSPHFLREHVTALSNFHNPETLQFHFSDDRTITFTHAQLSSSPWSHLLHLTYMTVDASSESFDKIKQFIYCTPIDLSIIPRSLVKAAWDWRLQDLYNACFLVAETAQLTVVQLVEKYIPLIQTTNPPSRFKRYLAGRIAVDAVHLRQWIRHSPNEKVLCHALQQSYIDQITRNAINLYSDLHETDILPKLNSSSSSPERKTFPLVWRVPLAQLLASSQEYVETELSTPHVSASLEITWNSGGATLVVGVQCVNASGPMDVSAAVIGLPCLCADQNHNTGWQLEGGVEERNLDWVLSHEVGFVIFDQTALREWQNAHKNCGLLVKIRIAIADFDVGTYADRDTSATEATNVNGGVSGS